MGRYITDNIVSHNLIFGSGFRKIINCILRCIFNVCSIDSLTLLLLSLSLFFFDSQEHLV